MRVVVALGVLTRSLSACSLNRIVIDKDTNDTVAELFYSSFYRQFLSPNNATGEGQGAFLNTKAPYLGESEQSYRSLT